MKKRCPTVSSDFVRLLIKIISRQDQAQRAVPDWLGFEYAIEKHSNKLLDVAELDSGTWEGQVKRIRGKKHPLRGSEKLCHTDGLLELAGRLVVKRA